MIHARTRTIVPLMICFALWQGHIARAQDTFTATDGITTLHLDPLVVKQLGLTALRVVPTETPPTDAIGFIVAPPNKFTFSVENGAVRPAPDVFLAHRGSLVLSLGARVFRLREPRLQLVNGTLMVYSADEPVERAVFQVPKATFTFDAMRSALVLSRQAFTLTPHGQALLGLTATSPAIGFIESTITALKGPSAPRTGTAADLKQPLASAPDVTFCSLDSLAQYGREGDVVGLSMATTSWNIGSERLDWYKRPDWRHPYIVTNLYRIKDGSFQQIGQSWVKHGFYALSDSQCGPGCTEETDGSQLGVNCTDTYNVQTNAVQTSLEARFEIDPWRGYWLAATDRHAEHKHNGIQHRLQVHDRDLDLKANEGAQYIAEGYYVQHQDTDVMNSAAWKSVTIEGQNAAREWKFGMSDETVLPNVGFAISAWTGAKQTMIAQQLPAIRNVSPDGRALLAAKPTQLADGRWRYDYALLNIDMDRQVSAFQVSISANAQVSDIGFHAVAHAGEPFNAPGGTPIDNTAWAGSVDGAVVKWQTSTNPLRWGTVYSFWFTAASGPGETDVELGLFKTGTPSSITARSVGPR
jgi:hypothetical protein